MSMGRRRTAWTAAAFGPYAVTAELLGLAAPDAIVLHCLPAYRGQGDRAAECSTAAIGDLGRGREPRHVQKAILAFLAFRRASDDRHRAAAA
jgi:ornithine carbamoyltransferase